MTKSRAILRLNPAPGYVLVEPLEEEKTTPSGIVLPESHEEKPQKGKVIAVGATFTTEYGTKIASPCKKGDVVVFKKWAGNEYKPEDEDKEYLFVKFEDILAVVR